VTSKFLSQSQFKLLSKGKNAKTREQKKQTQMPARQAFTMFLNKVFLDSNIIHLQQESTAFSTVLSLSLVAN